MTERNDIMQRILNLRSLAESTTSETEAMNAMKVAGKLMHSYRIEEAELALAEGLGEIKVEIVDQMRFDIGLKVGRNRHKVQSVLWALEKYCEVEIVLKPRYGQDGIHIIGDKPDVELFWYLLDLCRNSLDASYDAWKHHQQAVGRGAKASFQLAMADRLSKRLRDMTYERAKERSEAQKAAAAALNKPLDDIRMAVNNGDLRALSGNTALVVVSAAQAKQRAVHDAYATAYKNVRLGTASGFSYRGGTSAAAAGRAAGDRVNFGRPVGGNTTAGRLN